MNTVQEKILTPPAASANIGAKLDYLARCLGPSLEQHGFQRKSRSFFASVGEGNDTAVACLNLQGNKYNRGSSGGFWINLGIINIAVSQLVSEIPFLRDMREQVERADYGTCPLRARLNEAMPERPERLWPRNLRRKSDFEIVVGNDTDLDAMASTIAGLLEEHAIPWFRSRAGLAFLFGYEGHHWYGNTLASRMAAGIILGEAQQAEAMFRDTFARKGFHDDEMFTQIQTWAIDHGIPVSDLDYLSRPVRKPERPGLMGFLAERLDRRRRRS